ncbi:MAG: hypothetical protein WD600_06780, partial [Pseudohongiella sp.]
MPLVNNNNRLAGSFRSWLSVCKTLMRLTVCAAMIATPLALAISMAQAQTEDFTLGFSDNSATRELTLPIGKTQIISSARALEQVIVG